MKVGHLTDEMISTFLNLSLIIKDKTLPALSLTMSLMLVKGDISKRAQGKFLDAK